MKKKFWTSDKLVALSALCISLLTLVIFIRQTNIMEKQSHLSAMPYLMIEGSDQGLDKMYILDLVNHGVGPAIIVDRKITYKGKEYDLEFDEFLREHVEGMDSVKIISNSTVHRGLALPAGSSRTVIKVGGGAKSYNNFMKVLEKLSTPEFDYKISYKSIYNDHWYIDARDTEPTALQE